MKEFLWLIVALPFTGALTLIIGGGRLSRLGAGIIGSGSVVLAAILTLLAGIGFLEGNPSISFNQTLWQWMNVDGLSPSITFHLDTVSLVFIFVVTFVGALIHLYSVHFMWKDEGIRRFFIYMNLFVGFMLTLVLADNLLLLYMGWEGVGLCSYLLIGFWYKKPANGYAARKAFIVTRVGDFALTIGLFVLIMSFHSLNIQYILTAAPGKWAVGSNVAFTAALLLLCGALGKSAQLPLQTWLPDAMAGPSPVSALIHSATMVTAGVYLIARTHVLFELAPVAQTIIAVIGAATLLVAGLAALNQHDIKRVLAYSTISQIGYMFLALGVGAWSAAIFHFMIHAFFKALLFLGAGAVIFVMDDEHNMFKMGGLRKKLPVTFWTFLIGAGSLSALPLVTAGFYSKDMILWLTYSSSQGSAWLWLAGLAGAFITALYAFRMVFLTFFGKEKMTPTQRPGLLMTIPLVVLSILSLIAGFIELPGDMGHLTLFSDFIGKTLPATLVSPHAPYMELLFQVVSAVVVLAGITTAYACYFNKSFPAAVPTRNVLQKFLYQGWDFDIVYDRLIVRPLVYLAEIDKDDIIDRFYSGLAFMAVTANKLLSATQSGRLRRYAMAIAIGAIITLTIILSL